MRLEKKYTDYAIEQMEKLLSIDSPTGFTDKAAEYLIKEYEKLGYKAELTNKGCVLVSLGGDEEKNCLLMSAHIDTLGAMVAEIKENGRLKITPLGGLSANNIETENCRIYTRDNKVYEGCAQLVDASIHVNRKYHETVRDFNTMEIVIDEAVSTKEAVHKLGIDNGDIVCFSPRTRVTKSGYIKSRFLDDKLSAAILLAFAKYAADERPEGMPKIYQYFTVYEEVGHGASASIPTDVKEVLSVDMGCIGEGLTCTEHEVSICAKDSGGPYNHTVVCNLIEAAKKSGADYAVDIYPSYGSDAEATLRAGYDVRHGLIGPGVYASHGYERSHVDAVTNTLNLLSEYVIL